MPLPPTFAGLPTATRVALGLRLLRGMSTEQIGLALDRPQTACEMLLDGLLAVAGTRGASRPECRSALLARLDDDRAAREHLVRCAECRVAVPLLDTAERTLALDLQLALRDHILPATVERSFTRELEQPPAELDAGGRRMLLVLLSSGVVLLVLVALIWPRRSVEPSPATGATDPHALLDRARGAVTAVPTGEHVVHRQWQIVLSQPARTLWADEWIDGRQPARHRMQLAEGSTIVEWQAADGQEDFRYFASAIPRHCGLLPSGMARAYMNEINRWKLSAAEQTALREARWHSGVWALGQRYLDLAARAESLRSVGRTGSGEAAAVTLAAAGREISGTLLLSISPIDFALREVREIRSDNGRTVAHTPWRLVSSERVTPVEALRHSLLDGFPAKDMPDRAERTEKIVDRACPLPGIENAWRVPRALAAAGDGGGLVGLPELPADMTQVIAMGNGGQGMSGESDSFFVDPDALQLIYVGKGRRLAFRRHDTRSLSQETIQVAGPWRVQLNQIFPGLIVATAVPHVDAGDLRMQSGYFDGFRVWADGWTTDELIALLAKVRPLRLVDWAARPEVYYDPKPLDRITRELLAHAIRASAARTGQSFHGLETTTRRQAPFLQQLDDPYHLSAELRPAVKRTETWEEIDRGGTRVARAQRLTTGPDGTLIEGAWSDGTLWHFYRGASNTVTTESAYVPTWSPSDVEARELTRYDWILDRTADGGFEAQTMQPLQRTDYMRFIEGQRSTPFEWSYEPWLADIDVATITLRLRFGADGQLRERLVSGIASPELAASDGASAPIELERMVVERREWLSAAPEDAFSYKLPRDAKTFAAGSPAMFGTSTTDIRNTASLSETTRAVDFPVLVWPGEEGLPQFRSARLPPAQPNRYSWLEGDEQLLYEGVAVSLLFITPQGVLDVIQGPQESLRKKLRQRFPTWQRSERRTIEIDGEPREAWVLASDVDNHRRAIVEYRSLLLILDHRGPPSELDVVLGQLGRLEDVPKPARN